MANVSTVVFDIGGVLLTNGWDRHERESVVAHFGLDRDQYESRHTLANELWEKGLIGVEEYLARTVFYEPRPFTPGEFFAEMQAMSKILPDNAWKVAEDLDQSGEFELALLSNESRELSEYRFARFPFSQHFDAFFISCYVGLRKPDLKIYRMAVDILQRKPEEVVFIDDREENCAAAKSAGIHSIRYQGEAQLRQALEGFGVRITPERVPSSL